MNKNPEREQAMQPAVKTEMAISVKTVEPVVPYMYNVTKETSEKTAPIVQVKDIAF